MKRSIFLRLCSLIALTVALVMIVPTPAAGQESDDLQARAAEILASMSVPERIGQLFLVTFEGDRAAPDSEIADLILNYHIGGVSLLSRNNNLTGYGNPEDTPQQVRELTANLQRLALLGYSEELPSQTPEDVVGPPAPALPPTGAPVPLLVATQQDGDSLPLSNILAGYTPIPNHMAIGATWQPANARRVGEVVGRELAATGVNFLLGPSLDVLERPSPLSGGDLGTHSFGGDPYWIGLMGRAFIEGLHAGSSERLGVAAASFPGRGSSDRRVDDEVATVRRSLEQLKQLDLAPFFTVTRDPLGSPSAVDALLATHIRYQGFQGNIRATTAPVSLDPQALSSLMSLPEFAPWRQGGGVIVSDSLGARSVTRFYDDTEREFPHRQVAKDALLAGNDLLYVADFALGADNNARELANVKDTIAWFQGRYETDPTFQQRVDEAVLRILQMKLRLYGGDFSSDNVLAYNSPENPLPSPTQTSGTFYDIAESAVTLLAPSEDELTSRLVSPPAVGDRIVIFTDVREIEPCDECPEQPLLSQTALEERILALYGPSGSAQVLPDNITSFSFAELDAFLDAGTQPIPFPTTSPPATPEETDTESEGAATPTLDLTPEATATLPADYRVQEALRDADWVVFAPLNSGANADSPHAGALARFLSVRSDLASKSQVVVLAFDAPYFLDSTQISKLTAYYGVYSKTAPFVDAAVRALFLESPLSGRSPVSVEGIQYDLFTQTQPDSTQVIALYLVIDGEIQAPSSQESVALAIGDTLYLRTGVILDHNGNPVPDGTLVRFVLRDRVQGTVNIIGDRPTVNGTAQLDYVLDARMGPGQFRITAESGSATLSQEVDIAIQENAQLAIISPTPAPTDTPSPTATPTETPAPTLTPTPPPPTATPSPPEPEPEAGLLIGLTQLRSLLTVIGGLIAVTLLVLYFDGRVSTSSLTRRTGSVLWAVTGGLLVYNYFALGLPGAAVVQGLGVVGGSLLILAGGAVGFLLYRTAHTR